MSRLKPFFDVRIIFAFAGVALVCLALALAFQRNTAASYADACPVQVQTGTSVQADVVVKHVYFC